MTATKENARPVAATTGTGGGNSKLVLLSDDTERLPRSHSITGAGARQYKIARYETNGDAFQRVKDAVTVPDAAALYGYEPDRKGFIRCPFHGGGNEKTPSYHLKERYFKCFACKEGGDVIKFTAKLFNLSPLDAVKRLNTDFNIGLSLDRRAPTAAELEAARKRRKERATRRKFADWVARAVWSLSTACGIAYAARESGPPWTDAQMTAIRYEATFDYWRGLLESGEESEQLEILRDWPAIGERLAPVIGGEVCA